MTTSDCRDIAAWILIVERVAHVVLFTQLLAKGRAHDGAADAGRGAEVRLARLPARGVGCCEISNQRFFNWHRSSHPAYLR